MTASSFHHQAETNPYMYILRDDGAMGNAIATNAIYQRPALIN